MRKKVATDQLQLGVYIDELCGSWMDHPFWRTNFLLKDPTDLQRLRKSSVREVWIDTRKGLDIKTGKSEAEVAMQVEETLSRIDTPRPSPNAALNRNCARRKPSAPSPSKPFPPCSRMRAWAR